MLGPILTVNVKNRNVIKDVLRDRNAIEMREQRAI